MSPLNQHPVRATNPTEREQLQEARKDGPCIAWRDRTDELRIYSLAENERVMAGRSTDHRISFDRDVVSRDHLEFERRARGTAAGVSDALWLCDVSMKGTQHRPVTWKLGAEHTPGPLAPLPQHRPIRLTNGEHDLLLAGAVWLRVDGVPFDGARTADDQPDAALPARTAREHDVLVELCRPRFTEGITAAIPTNAEIGARLRPTIAAKSVSELMKRLYDKYDLNGTKEQNRMRLVEIAMHHHLVNPQDF